ncbi:DUF7093 family protein [Natrarchaeobius oligotrophus]|uniref:Uncharacterized protein n=1 Tax=Natrarchaeobius chitinivorans TaxID=1679083 RepID=A0A3N6MGS1_NATCH|nr:hypothetical protein [Natrarchaeobius chitinivorans]RQH03274.1 hypothetical protein EA472_01445 [Natrarchaeobius chitinivorans]
MVLRCSLLGHDYGESEVEREREERGSEVVVTVQEYEECLRCGQRNVISENTEVTSIVTGPDGDPRPDDSTLDAESESPPEHVGASPDSDAADPHAADSDAAESDAVVVDAEPTDAQPASDRATDPDDVDVPTDDAGDPITDDGEILEDDGDSSTVSPGDSDAADDRDHGEWPDSDDVGSPEDAVDEPASWPEADDGPVEDEPVEDDAIVLEHDESAVDSSTGAEAVATESEILNAANGVVDSETDDDSASGSGIERAGSVPTPGENGSGRADEPTEFYCPRCEFVAGDDRGSLRAGDICPDCRKGYLGERPLR